MKRNWQLGDVIVSKPSLVEAPTSHYLVIGEAENYLSVWCFHYGTPPAGVYSTESRKRTDEWGELLLPATIARKTLIHLEAWDALASELAPYHKEPAP